MQYFIFDKDFYSQADISGKGIDSATLSYIVTNNSMVNVSVIDYSPKIVVTSEVNQIIKEDTFLKNFDNTFVLQDEKIAENTFQVVGINSDVVKQIYASLKNQSVNSVIPYGLAIRAFLKFHNIIPTNKVIVFIDKLGDKILLTFFADMIFTRTSKIVYANITEISSEIKRHVQNYASLHKKESNEEISYTFVTNYEETYKHLVSQNVARLSDCILLDCPFPAIEGHSSAKFDMHFLLPEDLLRLRKQQEFKNRLKFIAGAGISLCIGLFVFISGSLANNFNTNKLNVLVTQKNVLNKELISENVKHYKSYFNGKKEIPLGDFVYNFINNVPAGHFVQGYSIVRQGDKWKFEGIVTPGVRSIEMENFLKRGFFKTAKIEYILINDKPSQKVTLVF